MAKSVGIDLGSQVTMMVKDDADIILTDTGSMSRPTLLAFLNRTRLFGEEAFPQILGDSAIAQLNQLAGKTHDEIVKSGAFAHKQSLFSKDGNNRLMVEINYNGDKQPILVNSLLGMYFSKLYQRIVAVNGPDAMISFALPPKYTKLMKRSYKEACIIAGIDESKLFFVESSDCLVSAYERKLASLLPKEKANIEGKIVALIEMGHTQTTVIVVNVNTDPDTLVTRATKLSVAHDGELGAYYFDLKLFAHFAAICKEKHGSEIDLNSKRGMRLLNGCERIRKLLSTVNEASITVENMSDNGDISFTLKRDEFSSLCSDLITNFRALISTALVSSLPVTTDSTTPTVEQALTAIAAVEVLGGGIRMPIVQAVVTSVFGENIPLGAKFDDASVALGAAMLCNHYTEKIAAQDAAKAALASLTGVGSDIDSSAAAAAAALLSVPPSPNTVVAGDADSDDDATSVVGLTKEELEQERAKEVAMQAQDAEIVEMLAARNRLESYILEMRNAPRHKKHGSKITRSTELNAILDSNEEWLWDHVDDVTLAEVTDKFTNMVTECGALCADYFTAIDAEKKAMEAELEAEAVKAAAERELNGEDDEDHDTRKLKKADRMRLVVKNKEEGTELFKGGNYRPAGARYQKALTHCAKFFDLSKEDEAEVNALKLSLYLNLASVYIKLESWEQVLRNCTEALALDPANVKALFRRSTYYEKQKDWDKAAADLKKC